VKEQLKYLFISQGTLTMKIFAGQKNVDSREHYSLLYIQSDYIVREKFLSSAELWNFLQ